MNCHCCICVCVSGPACTVAEKVLSLSLSEGRDGVVLATCAQFPSFMKCFLARALSEVGTELFQQFIDQTTHTAWRVRLSSHPPIGG